MAKEDIGPSEWPVTNPITHLEEKWVTGSVGFEHVRAGATTLSTVVDDMDSFAPAIASACLSSSGGLCARQFPRPFDFCPWCKATLERQPQAPLWSYPYGEHDGKKRVAHALRVPTADLEVTALLPTEGNDWIFAVVGSPRRLIALSSAEGVAHIWSHSKKMWYRIRERMPHPASRLSFGVASTDWGAWFTTDCGLAALVLEGAIQTPKVVVGGTGECVGGPYLLSDGSAIAPMQQSGELVLELAILRDGQAERLALRIENGSEADIFGLPVRLASGDILWPGRRGVIVAHLDSDDTMRLSRQVAWLAWPSNTMGLPHLGAAIVQSAPWLPVVETKGDQQVRSYRRPVAGLEAHEWEERQGFGHAIGAGGILFRHRDRVELPWGPTPVFTFGGTVHGVVPLLSFRDQSFLGLTYEISADDADPWASLLDDRREVFLATLWLSEPNHPGIRLFPQIEVSSLFDVQAFIYDQGLYVYERLRNRLRRWACEC